MGRGFQFESYMHLKAFIKIILSASLFLFPSVGDAADIDLEKDLQKNLAQSKALILTIDQKLLSGNSAGTELAQLKALSDDIRASHLLLQERFRLREEKVKALGSKAVDRQQEMAEGYRKALEEYLSLIESLPAAGNQESPARTQKKIEKLKAILDKILPKKRRPIIGSLPYKHLNYPAQEPNTGPAITPAYKGGNKTVSPEDIKGTDEAPISKEIATFAQSLNWNPVSIYEYVKNNIETEWYWGCMKGAEETLRQKSGNDCDQATLLTALLRASGFPTRYVRGTIEFFPDIQKSKNLTGIDDPAKIAEFFQKAGIPYTPVIAGGKISNFRIEHIWVESEIPYANYRGVVIDANGKAWLGLDTSIKVKDYTYNNPKDIFQDIAISSQLSGIRDNYLGAVQTQTPLEYLQSSINSELATQNSQLIYSNFIRIRTLSPENMKILPASMQFTQVKITNEYTSIPDELIHKIKFTGTNSNNGELFTITLSAYKLSNQQIVMSYEPETVEDQEIIDSYGGLDNTPAYLVRLRPVLKLNGERMIVAKDGLPTGADYNLTLEFYSPSINEGATTTEKITNTHIVGNLSVIGVVAQKAVAVTSSPPAGEGGGEGDKDAERLLYESAIHYIDRWNQAEDELASLLHLTIARPLPAVVTVGGVIDVSYVIDIPHGFTWKGVYVDADMRSVEPVASDELRVKTFMQLSSLQGSILENRIFEDDFQVQSISTAKLLTQASTGQISIITIDSTNIETVLPTLPVDQNIKDDIVNSVNQHQTVRIPAQELNYEDWTGIGYIKENPSTGESGWMLSGMIAGGMTAWGLDKWPEYYAERLTNPNSEPANYDPASARFIQKVTSTDMQTGKVGAQLSKPFKVKVLDQNQKPVRNVEITFTVRAGGGTLTTDTVKAKTDYRGIASTTLTLGQKTSANPTFWWYEDQVASPKPEQVCENLVDAALPTGAGITTPFTAYGFPKDPHHLKQVYPLSDMWSVVLSFAGFVSVNVADEYNNPVSNVPVTFTAADPVQNPSEPNCAWTTMDSRKTYLTETSLSCIKDSPTWGTCGDTDKQSLEVKSDHTGAAAQVMLGGMEDAIYTIKAKALNFSESFTFKTLDSYNGGECPRIDDPLRQLVAAYTYPADPYGNSINAGKVGATIPVQAKLYYLVENEEQKNVSLACGSGTLTCSKIVGTRQYAATTDFTSSSVTFSDTPGVSQGGGIYKTNYTLQSGPNTITINGAATIPINKTTMSCPSTCNTEHNVPFTQSTSITMQVYGVDIILQNPGSVFIDENGYSLNNLVAQYTITPAEYKANTAFVMILKNGEPVAYVSSEKSGTGTGTFLKGMQFDTNSVYEAQVVLNYGSGVEIRSDTKRVSLHRVQLVDKDDKLITAKEIGEYDKFVSWETLEIKYKITPEIPEADYDWEVTSGTAFAAGHPYLGTPDPQNKPTDKTLRIIKFIPGAKDGKPAANDKKAKPLAFILNFKYKGQIVYKVPVEQNYRNAIREEYKVYREAFKDNPKYPVPADGILPSYTDFDGAFDPKYHKNCDYNVVDVPKGAKLNELAKKLPKNATTNKDEFTITSAYRNPYRNEFALSNSPKSSHVWSGAFDLQDENGQGFSEKFKTLWTKIKDMPEFGQVYVESDYATIKKFLEEHYIPTVLKKAVVANTVECAVPDASPGYAIVWSKTSAVWKSVTFNWKETEKQEVPTTGTYTFKVDDWDHIARNLHAQDKTNDAWGWEP